ncbi:MAG: DNA cytosine methyltransferase [Rhodospirillaceae bacterium]|nr:DNA cytosine methyltransferase [Rhodospirillaceae bacterium]
MFAMLNGLHRLGGAKHAPTAIDLFSGAGGITLGLAQAGFDVRLSADISAACGVTHQRNFPRIPFLQCDVSRASADSFLKHARVKPGELDLLIGGPPCQGFSILGRREADDPRNGLFRDFFRVASKVKPKVVVIENVPGLATLNDGLLLQQIGRSFDRAGYNADCAELLAAQYGVPQMRWRMFFIGWRKDLGLSGLGFPAPTHGRRGIGDLVPNHTISPDDMKGFVSIRDAIGDLPVINSGELLSIYDGKPTTTYQRLMRVGMGRRLYNHYAPKLSPQNLRRIEHLKPGEDWRNLPYELLPRGMQQALRKDHTRRYRRMTWEGIARSIITRFRDPKSGEYIHPSQKRTISIREAARIQSFPDWFEFTGNYSEQYEQVGNAVPPLLASAVAMELYRGLTGAVKDSDPVKSRYKFVA